MINFYLGIFFSMFVIMDPVGNVPAVVGVTSALTPERIRRVLLREFLAAALLLCAFGAAGHWLLDMLSVQLSSLKISGGIILFMIAISLFTKHMSSFDYSSVHEPFITPIAFPLIAGPGAITNVMFFVHRAQTVQKLLGTILMIAAAWLITCLVLYHGMRITRLLSQRVREAVSKLMGMLLLAIAVEMILHGIAEYFNISLKS